MNCPKKVYLTETGFTFIKPKDFVEYEKSPPDYFNRIRKREKRRKHEMETQKRKCAFCNKPSTKVFTPLLGTIPIEPQGNMEYKINGSGVLCCDKHELSYECVKIEAYPHSINKL